MVIVKEASLSRTLEHMNNHDTGFVTASRSEYSSKENKQRNKKLLARLLQLGFSVTTMRGSYIENYGTPEAVEVKENSFFVIDSNDKGNLEKTLRFYGEDWDQDSIIFVPKGKVESHWWGTSKKCDMPGYGNMVKFTDRMLGKDGQFMTKVKGRPFIFESALNENTLPTSMAGRAITYKIAEMDWRDIDVSGEMA